jgi:transposase InsO family protein
MKNLRKEGFEICRDRARRLMKVLNRRVKQKRKYKVTTDSKHQLPVAENVLNRHFSPQAPNQAWGTDITNLWTQDYNGLKPVSLSQPRHRGWAHGNSAKADGLSRIYYN